MFPTFMGTPIPNHGTESLSPCPSQRRLPGVLHLVRLDLREEVAVEAQALGAALVAAQGARLLRRLQVACRHRHRHLQRRRHTGRTHRRPGAVPAPSHQLPDARAHLLGAVRKGLEHAHSIRKLPQLEWCPHCRELLDCLQQIIGRHKLQTPGSIKEAVDVWQGEQASSPLHGRRQECSQLPGQSHVILAAGSLLGDGGGDAHAHQILRQPVRHHLLVRVFKRLAGQCGSELFSQSDHVLRLPHQRLKVVQSGVHDAIGGGHPLLLSLQQRRHPGCCHPPWHLRSSTLRILPGRWDLLRLPSNAGGRLLMLMVGIVERLLLPLPLLRLMPGGLSMNLGVVLLSWLGTSLPVRLTM
mmetsp:Transcript_15225/g.45952  ORF Transcript_15225/g.45952 Transcript_15225/m.45952 type:complete len:355 (-) Transcript_15225:475-1539(-)